MAVMMLTQTTECNRFRSNFRAMPAGACGALRRVKRSRAVHGDFGG
jgi:hypothetical protein